MKVALENVSKSFGKQKVLNDFSLCIEKPSIVCLMGASGSGKTTVLRIIAGLERADFGDVFVEGSVGVVFQEPRLFPWLNALDNVLCVNNSPARAKEILSELGLGKDISKFPRELSGGMQQRVAFARAIINAPDILLLDEGFGSQDTNTAKIMYDMCKKIVSEEGKIIIAVTHNREEAELLAGDNIIYI